MNASTPQLFLQRFESLNDLFLLRMVTIFDNALAAHYYIFHRSF